MTERKTLSVTEAAKALGICRNKAYEAARRGEIPTIKIGKRHLNGLQARLEDHQSNEPPAAGTASGSKSGKIDVSK
jgi:excisionase family DNA binding protein